MDNAQFNQILSDNEYILKIYMPNKKRYILSSLLIPLVTTLMILAVTAMFIVFSYIFKEPADISEMIPVFIIMGLLIFVLIYAVIKGVVTYSHTYFAITNKRLIVKNGRRENFYQYFELNDIGYTQIKTTFLDKMVHPNTGTIIFSNKLFHKGVIVQRVGAQQTYILSFYFIENPKEVLKYINSIAEQAKLEA